jgi:hypothetical protein
MPNLCGCGCGEETKYNKKKKCYNRFLQWHNNYCNRFKEGSTPANAFKSGMDHPQYGISRTEEQKQAISLAHKDKPLSDEHKHNISISSNGKIMSDKARHNMSLAKLGTHLSEERKRKLSDANRGKIMSDTHKQKISSANKGNPKLCKENNSRYGQPAAKGSGYGKGSYCDKGHWVRSTYERPVADWLFNHNEEYEYEPELFHFGRYSYRPDFYLPRLNLYIETKGRMLPKNIIQHRMFIKTGHNLIVLDEKFFGRDKLFEQVLQKLEEDIRGGYKDAENAASSI